MGPGERSRKLSDGLYVDLTSQLPQKAKFTNETYEICIYNTFFTIKLIFEKTNCNVTQVVLILIGDNDVGLLFYFITCNLFI